MAENTEAERLEIEAIKREFDELVERNRTILRGSGACPTLRIDVMYEALLGVQGTPMPTPR